MYLSSRISEQGITGSMPSKKLIGITGQIGSGKSEVAEIFRQHGAYVISADLIGKEVVENNPAVLRRLVKTFGREILTPKGRLRRRRLGEIVFSSDQNKNRLNKIVHPPLLNELDKRVNKALKKYDLVVIDAALLIDWDWDKKVDLTILVHSRDDVKIKRLEKKGLSKKEARQRIKSQIKYSILRKRSNIVIFNNKSLASLRLKVEKIIKRLEGKRLT